MATPEQPADSWDYVRTDSDDEDPTTHPDPEDAAVHLEEGAPSPGDDPARRDEGVDVEDDDGPRSQHFTDEEPEGTGWTPIDEHEPDLEEILEAQHYAFPAEDEQA